MGKRGVHRRYGTQQVRCGEPSESAPSDKAELAGRAERFGLQHSVWLFELIVSLGERCTSSSAPKSALPTSGTKSSGGAARPACPGESAPPAAKSAANPCGRGAYVFVSSSSSPAAPGARLGSGGELGTGLGHSAQRTSAPATSEGGRNRRGPPKLGPSALATLKK